MTDAPNPEAMTETAEAILAVADELDKPIEIPRLGLIDLPASQYHADPCETPSLNQTTANALLKTSPEHAYHLHPRLGAGRRKWSPALTGGSIVHELLLGGDRIVKLHHFELRTKVARAERDAAIAKGKTPIVAHKLKPFQNAADALRSKLEKRNIQLAQPPALTEVSAFWDSFTSDGVAVPCRARLDELIITKGERAVITDVKMCANANPLAIEKSVENFGYALQRAAYVEAVETNYPDLCGRVDYLWIFCEWAEPFGVSVARATGELRALGEMRWQRAVDLWERCLRTNEWPGYDADEVVHSIGVAPWVMSAELEAEAI